MVNGDDHFWRRVLFARNAGWRATVDDVRPAYSWIQGAGARLPRRQQDQRPGLGRQVLSKRQHAPAMFGLVELVRRACPPTPWLTRAAAASFTAA